MAGFDIELFFVNLAATIVLYSLPIIITRYVVLKRPLDKHPAKIVTIVYACFAFIATYVIATILESDTAKIGTFPLVLWSYINYKMLTTGKNRKSPAKNNVVSINSTTKADKLPILSFKPPKSADNTEKEAPPNKRNRQRYCKNCGGPIDNKKKKCMGCGKQYFHLPKVTLLRGIVIILIIALTGLAVFQLTQTIEANNYILTLENKLQSTQESLDTYKESYKSLLAENNSTKKELYFWDNYAVIVTEAGSKYHRYGCYHLDDCKSFWIYNIEAAKSRGYTPCLDCCG